MKRRANRELTSAPRSKPERRELLESLAEAFDDPGTVGIDWDVLREGKQRSPGPPASDARQVSADPSSDT